MISLNLIIVNTAHTHAITPLCILSPSPSESSMSRDRTRCGIRFELSAVCVDYGSSLSESEVSLVSGTTRGGGETGCSLCVRAVKSWVLDSLLLPFSPPAHTARVQDTCTSCWSLEEEHKVSQCFLVIMVLRWCELDGEHPAYLALAHHLCQVLLSVRKTCGKRCLHYHSFGDKLILEIPRVLELALKKGTSGG